MSHQIHHPSRPAAKVTSTAMLGTSLLITRSPRNNRALAGLMRAPSGRIT